MYKIKFTPTKDSRYDMNIYKSERFLWFNYWKWFCGQESVVDIEEHIQIAKEWLGNLEIEITGIQEF